MRPIHRPLLLGLLLIGPCLAPAILDANDKGKDEGLFVADRKGPDGTVLLLNNCDASDAPDDDKNHPGEFVNHFPRYVPDNLVCSINGPKDFQQFEPILVRPFAADGAVQAAPGERPAQGPDPAGGEGARLPRRRRGRGRRHAQGPRRAGAAGAGERLAASLSDVWTLSDDETKRLAKDGLQLYAEGLQFGVTCRLELSDGGGVRDRLPLQVAPFLLLPHTRSPVRNMVVHVEGWGDSDAYEQAFRERCDEAKKLFPTALKDLEAQIVTIPSKLGDVWIEDELQWGYTETPRCRMPVALHMNRMRQLKEVVPGLVGPGIGYFQAFDYKPASSLDYGGDLEVTPPTAKWPFGRVYYGGLHVRDQDHPRGHATPDNDLHPCEGRAISDGYRRFFRRQKRAPEDPTALQEPIELFTEWLDVGHVDEIVSFVPVKKDADHPNGFVLLWASPAKALELLRQPGAERKLDPRYEAAFGSLAQHFRTMDDFLNAKTLNPQVGSFLGTDLQSYNQRVDAAVRDAVATFKTELDLKDSEIMPVPVLFMNAVGGGPPRTTGRPWR